MVICIGSSSELIIPYFDQEHTFADRSFGGGSSVVVRAGSYRASWRLRRDVAVGEAGPGAGVG
jgi:hypothetical protein